MFKSALSACSNNNFDWWMLWWYFKGVTMVRDEGENTNEASSFSVYENMNNLSSNFSMTFDSFFTAASSRWSPLHHHPFLRLSSLHFDLILFDWFESRTVDLDWGLCLEPLKSCWGDSCCKKPRHKWHRNWFSIEKEFCVIRNRKNSLTESFYIKNIFSSFENGKNSAQRVVH